MAKLIASDSLKVIVGIGVTGISVARHLSRRGDRFVVVDTREKPPALEDFVAEFPDIPVELGELQPDTLARADEIVLSPGISPQHPGLVSVLEQGIPVVGDIELFAREANAPVIAITGSNGKSTLTTLVGEMCAAAGKNAGVGGNLGVPALELLSDDRDMYVLELSSFQLETLSSLNAEVATVLNISSDHMDRYPDLLAYHQAKHRIFVGARQVVINRADKLTVPLVPETTAVWSFGLDRPDFHGFGLLQKEGENWLAYQFDLLMPESELAIKGKHNTANALAALALGSAVGLPMAAMVQTLRQFKGLRHRCETVASHAGVTYINDSKATNVGATQAAIEGLAAADNLVLIAGGQAKGQDFAPLAKSVVGAVKLVVLIGEDAALIAAAIADRVPVVFAASLADAVDRAHRAASENDIVLLSPACASFDMFRSFEERGDQFAEAVGGLR